MDVSEAKRLKALEGENAKLKRLLADAHAGQRGAEGSAGKKMVTPAVKREAVAHLKGAHEMSERRACKVIGCERMTVRYRSTAARRSAPARTAAWRWPGSAGGSATGACTIFLRREGFVVNHKRLFRIYREERLMVRKRGGRKRALGTRTPMPVPIAAERPLVAGLRLRSAASAGGGFAFWPSTTICTRECLAAVADVSLSGRRVARELDLLIAVRGKPKDDRQRQRHGTDQQRHPVLDGRQPASTGTTSIRASRCRTPSSRASMAACATSS